MQRVNSGDRHHMEAYAGAPQVVLYSTVQHNLSLGQVSLVLSNAIVNYINLPIRWKTSF